MALIALIVWIFLMMFWLFGGGWLGYDPGRPYMVLGNTIIPWCCVLIVGLFVFGAFGTLTLPR